VVVTFKCSNEHLDSISAGNFFSQGRSTDAVTYAIYFPILNVSIFPTTLQEIKM
jgi:hypothetical protein